MRQVYDDLYDGEPNVQELLAVMQLMWAGDVSAANALLDSLLHNDSVGDGAQNMRNGFKMGAGYIESAAKRFLYDKLHDSIREMVV